MAEIFEMTGLELESFTAGLKSNYTLYTRSPEFTVSCATASHLKKNQGKNESYKAQKQLHLYVNQLIFFCVYHFLSLFDSRPRKFADRGKAHYFQYL